MKIFIKSELTSYKKLRNLNFLFFILLDKYLRVENYESSSDEESEDEYVVEEEDGDDCDYEYGDVEEDGEEYVIVDEVNDDDDHEVKIYFIEIFFEVKISY